MNLQRVSVLVAMMVLAGCDSNDPFRPRLLADLTSDVTPPTLTAFDFSPKSINTSDAAASISVSFTVTDDLTGATGVVARFCNPSNTVCSDGSANFAATTSQSGSFTINFPQYSAAGTWSVAWVYTVDALGNYRYLFTADLSALGFPSTLSVTSTLQDVTPPSLTAFSFSPTSINTSNGAASITVSFTVTDDLTGATGVVARFCNPSNTVCSDGSANFAATTSGSGSFTINFPQYSAAGTWSVAWVYTVDALGNYRYLFTADLSALGFPGTLVVVNAVSIPIDIQPGSSQNAIKLSKQGKVTVAILADAGFDAPSRVTRSSLTFGHTGDEPSLASCAREGEDVNGDGFKDLVCQFYVQRTGFQVGDTQGILRGRTVDQVPIEGKDAVRVLK